MKKISIIISLMIRMYNLNEILILIIIETIISKFVIYFIT